jgi:ABC-2 type transport system permease protein
MIVLAVLVAGLRSVSLSVNNRPVDFVALAALPLGLITLFLVLTMVVVAIFYSLDALLSERRDRSLFFWKSLPVSDGVTVLSKVAVPMVLLPLVTFVIAFAAQLIVFVIENGILLAHHASLSALWTRLPWLSILALTAYGLVVITLWYAPIYAWFLLVSVWARRAALLWAVVPWFVLTIFETIAFHTKYVHHFIDYRFSGVFAVAFAHEPSLTTNRAFIPLSDLTPGHFLASPGLWGGLIFTALAVLLIIRLRRSSQPL